MPEYEYRAASGETVLRFFKMNDDKPDAIEVGGVEYERVWGNCQINGDPATSRYPYVSKAHMGTPVADDCDKATIEVGKKYRRKVQAPVVKSREHEKALCEKHGLTVLQD